VSPSIREAHAGDLPAILDMAEIALKEIHPALPFHREAAWDAIEPGIDEPSMLILVAEDSEGLCGLLIAYAEYSWFGPGLVASDWVTYVSPRAKGWLWYRLLETYTRWAESIGINVINTINLSGKDDERAVHAIGRLGYQRAGSMVRKIGKPYQGDF